MARIHRIAAPFRRKDKENKGQGNKRTMKKTTTSNKSQPSYPSYFPDPHISIPQRIMASRCSKCVDGYVFGKDGAGVYSVEWRGGTEYYNVGMARRIISAKAMVPRKPPGGQEMYLEMMLINQVDGKHVRHLREEWLDIPGILGEREEGKYVFMDGSHRLAGRMVREGVEIPGIIGITRTTELLQDKEVQSQWNRMMERIRNFQGMECWVMNQEETRECMMTQEQWEKEVEEKEGWFNEWAAEYHRHRNRRERQ
jgi:hypothetical protein